MYSLKIIVLSKVDKHNLWLFQLPVDQLSSLTRQIVSNPKLQPALKQREELADLIFRSIFPIVGLYPHPNHYQDALKSVWRAYPHLASLVEDRTALKVVTFGVNNFYFFYYFFIFISYAIFLNKNLKDRLHVAIKEQFAHHRKTDLAAIESADRKEAQRKHTPNIKRKSNKGHLAKGQTPRKD